MDRCEGKEKRRIEPDRARALDILQATPMSVSAARVNPPLEHRAEPSRESSHGHVPDARSDPGDRLINFFVLVESAHLDHSSSSPDRKDAFSITPFKNPFFLEEFEWNFLTRNTSEHGSLYLVAFACEREIGRFCIDPSRPIFAA